MGKSARLLVCQDPVLTIAVSLGILIAIICPSRTMAGEADACSAPLETESQQLNSKSEWWANGRTVISRTNSTVADMRSFYVLGDTVRLTPKNFPHLALDPSTALTKVERIVIDAREVIIDMPIHLASGRIEIRADKVTFTPNGYFAFYDPPKQSGEGVYIVARSLDTHAFSVKNYLPFQFHTFNISWTAGLSRKVSIAAAEVIGPLSGLSPIAAREKLWSSTFDTESALIPSGDADLAKRFELREGSDAEQLRSSHI